MGLCGVSYKSHKNVIGGASVYNRAQGSTTEPLQRATPFQHFFRLEGKKISVAAVATPRVTRFADFYFSKFGQRGL